MALKSTVYKVDLQIADMDRNYYADHSLTLARHPSETEERLMVRILAFALYASEDLAFGRGLCVDDEPDLWRRDPTGAIELWLDVGLPDEKWVRKACNRAQRTVILSYGGRPAEAWWQQNRDKLARLPRLDILGLSEDDSKAMAGMAQRSMRLQCTVQDGDILLTDGQSSLHLEPVILHADNTLSR
jgi:uncharacterized protein YaeQ